MNKYLRDLKKVILSHNLICKNPTLLFSKIKTQNLIFPNSFLRKKSLFLRTNPTKKKFLSKIDRFQMVGINKKVF